MALLFGDGLAYEWGTDWPETFDVLSMSKQHRPLSQKLSPLGVMEELNKLYYMARPRPGKPQAKPMPADLDGHTHEGEMETTSRKKAQKAWHHDQSGPGFAPPNGSMAAAHCPRCPPACSGPASIPCRVGTARSLPTVADATASDAQECQRAILPKGKKETPDLFLRRLDAHKINPMAMLVMGMPPESELDTVHRYIATKENEAEGLLVLPRTEHEGDAEFKDRMDLATTCPVLVLGKGENESADDFKLRLSSQAKARAPIMPRSYGEPEKSFKARMQLSLQMDGSVPAFYAKAESEREYAARLRLQKDKPDELLGHGDPLAKEAAKDFFTRSRMPSSPAFVGTSSAAFAS